MIREFKAQKNCVLFAAGSCWEGVDFPGDVVSSLIIVRLPFAVPDPVREAERERYQTLKEYIQKIIVPDMQIKLRQGCRTDFADIQNKKECGGNRQWQNHYLRNWAANTKGKGII